MFHKFCAFGYITKQPEIKALPNGNTLIRLPFATSTKMKNLNGEVKEEILYMDVLVSGKIIDQSVIKKFTKGVPLYVEGKLRVKTYDDLGNITQKKIQLIATDIYCVSVKNEVFLQENKVEEDDEIVISEFLPYFEEKQ